MHYEYTTLSNSDTFWYSLKLKLKQLSRGFVQNKQSIFLLASFCWMGLNCFSQDNSIKSNREVYHTEKSEKEQLNQLLQEMDGTFQFIVSGSEKQPLLSLQLLQKIKAERQQVQGVYLDVEQGIKIYIPSTSEIESSSFVKLEKIVYQKNILNNDENK